MTTTEMVNDMIKTLGLENPKTIDFCNLCEKTNNYRVIAWQYETIMKYSRLS